MHVYWKSIIDTCFTNWVLMWLRVRYCKTLYQAIEMTRGYDLFTDDVVSFGLLYKRCSITFRMNWVTLRSNTKSNLRSTQMWRAPPQSEGHWGWCHVTRSQEAGQCEFCSCDPCDEDIFDLWLILVKDLDSHFPSKSPLETVDVYLTLRNIISITT